MRGGALRRRADAAGRERPPGADGWPWTATLGPFLRGWATPTWGPVRLCWPLDGSLPHAPVQRARTLEAAETSTVPVREMALACLVLSDWPRVHALLRRWPGCRLSLSHCFDVPAGDLPPGTELRRCHLARDPVRARLRSGRLPELLLSHAG